MLSLKEEGKAPMTASLALAQTTEPRHGDLAVDEHNSAALSLLLLGATVTVRLAHAVSGHPSRSLATSSAALTGTLLEVRRLWLPPVPPEARAKRWRLPSPTSTSAASPVSAAAAMRAADKGPLLAYVRLKEGDHRLSGWLPLEAVEVKELAASAASPTAARAAAADMLLPAPLSRLVHEPVLSRVYWQVTPGMARTLRSQKQLDYLEERLLRDCQTPTTVRYMVYLQAYLFAPWYYAPYGLLHAEYDPLAPEAVCARQTSRRAAAAETADEADEEAGEAAASSTGTKTRRLERDGNHGRGGGGGDKEGEEEEEGEEGEEGEGDSSNTHVTVERTSSRTHRTPPADPTEEADVEVMLLPSAPGGAGSAVWRARLSYAATGRTPPPPGARPTVRADTATSPSSSPLPNAPAAVLRVNPYIRDAHLCPFSLRLFSTAGQLRYEISQYRAERLRPPGVELYRDTERGFSLFEVNGSRDVAYCRQLFLLGKSFLENKLAGHDVHNYYFYVVCLHHRHAPNFVADPEAMYFASYFTWEKQVTECNLACIVTLPCFATQGGQDDGTRAPHTSSSSSSSATATTPTTPTTLKGLGQFMIAVSYELAYRRHQVGSPEKPLSDLGAAAYQRYWQRVLLKWMAEHVAQHERDVAIHVSSSSNSLTAAESASQEADAEVPHGLSLRLKDMAEQVRLDEADVHTALMCMGLLHRCADDRSTQLLIPEKFVRWAVARDAASQKRLDVAVFSPEKLLTKKQATSATAATGTGTKTNMGKRR